MFELQISLPPFLRSCLLTACQRNAFSKFINGQRESSVEKAAFW